MISSENTSGKIFNIGLIVNIVLHVTILYTILANFFMFFIAQISSDAINHELKHSIDNAVEPILKNKDAIKQKINDLKHQYTTLLGTYNNMDEINNQSNLISSKLNDLRLQIQNLTFLNQSLPAQTNYGLPEINISQLSSYFKNMSFDYYLNYFNSNNTIREYNNKEVFSKIKIVNILLVLFLFILCGTLLVAESITFTELWHIILENLITFFFVGIVEVVFFLNIALKFVPAPPSLIFKSLLSSIKVSL